MPAVQFWKWMIETGENVEKAILNQKGVPLLHTVNNTAQMKAALWMANSIQCAHPPDPVVEEANRMFIIVSVVTGCVIVFLSLFVWHVVTTRHAMQTNPLKGVNVQQIILQVLEDVYPNTDGNVATYIPELGQVSPDLFGICICSVDGTIFKVGDWDYEFSIQSMSKPLGYAHALDQRGFDHMKLKVNVEPAGGAFDCLEMDNQNRPFNPYINSGAICCVMQLRGDMQERYEGLRQFMSGFCNKQVVLDERIYESESSTAVRNREISDKLEENQMCETPYEKEHGLEAYFMMCSTLLTTVDLATLAGTCANYGRNPISKQQVVDNIINEEMMSVMMTCGMYNSAGNWMVDVGIPAKSGVGGAIFGVVPGVCGVAVFSPRLNSCFNSVRGVEACALISQRLGLHVLQKSKSKVSFWEAITGVRKPRQVFSRTGSTSSERTTTTGWADLKRIETSNRRNRVAANDPSIVVPFTDSSLV